MLNEFLHLLDLGAELAEISSTVLLIQTEVGCVSIPGWSVVVVSTLLASPRLVKELRTPAEG